MSYSRIVKFQIETQSCQVECVTVTGCFFIYEPGQVSAQLISMLENNLRRLRRNSIPLGGVLIIRTLNHTQLVPVKVKPFIV